ncbi:predicted protein [Histoplasma capsulatum G186AR]|uniref:Uncharacterized protein n=1 Tax=Ajellomyces capsulatus (strain G186AR / H82 / ATCC MYA-2454 / RMSCC 2432) TaxID=447093 RepID=C0NXM6_AJECG|nr:uncharacterized protein HCBG_08218 [Histoplasma capsulatum G186AR]EEH04092.1 predicted protein [Histoplasma capsulatum G186AR]
MFEKRTWFLIRTRSFTSTVAFDMVSGRSINLGYCHPRHPSWRFGEHLCSKKKSGPHSINKDEHKACWVYRRKMWQVYCLALASAKSSTTTTNHHRRQPPPPAIRCTTNFYPQWTGSSPLSHPT